MKYPDFSNPNLTSGDLYRPAVGIKTKEEAEDYLRKLVQWSVEHHGKDPSEAERIQKSNLGYYAGYFDRETMTRVHELFSCAHPIFGKASDSGEITADDAYRTGLQAAKRKG